MEHYPDTLHHCCVVNVRSMTSATTLALEVLTIKFPQLPSTICVKVGEFADRGLLQFARVGKPLTITQRLFMHGINSTQDYSTTLFAEGLVGISDDGWGTDSDSMPAPKPTSSLISGEKSTVSKPSTCTVSHQAVANRGWRIVASVPYRKKVQSRLIPIRTLNTSAICQTCIRLPTYPTATIPRPKQRRRRVGRTSSLARGLPLARYLHGRVPKLSGRSPVNPIRR